MEKNKIIITSDIHIQKSTPVARTDNYLEALERKLVFLNALSIQKGLRIMDAGDLLSYWQIDPELEQWCIKFIPKMFTTIIGNHDMKNHNIKLWKKGSLSLLNKAGAISVLENYDDNILEGVRFHAWHYGTEVPKFQIASDKMNVLFMHSMVCQRKLKLDYFAYDMAKSLLRRFPYFNLIVSGHNHESFIVEYKGRKLLNPGSLMRRDVLQQDYKPRVFIWDSDLETIESIFVPCKDDVISAQHILTEEQRNEKLEAFISSIRDIKGKGLNFRDNLELYIKENKFDREFADFIWSFVE